VALLPVAAESLIDEVTSRKYLHRQAPITSAGQSEGVVRVCRVRRSEFTKFIKVYSRLINQERSADYEVYLGLAWLDKLAEAGEERLWTDGQTHTHPTQALGRLFW
jgi:hypothetical protein